MRKLTQTLQQCTYLLLFICVAKIAQGQNPPLELKNFAIWGGGASPSPYISTQGVFIKNNVNIQGNIGSNHLVDIEINLTLTGNIYSGNRVFVKNNAAITGNIFANRMGTTLSPSISGGTNNVITGNLTANGKITLISGQVIGSVAVTAPANTNYTGPVPSGGVGTNFTLPVMPSMPNNTPFDNPVGTTNITNTQTISPGIFGKLALTGNKTITFNGPGNYIFYEIDNGTTSNKFIFDLKNTITGTINLFIIKDVNLGKLSVSTVNGNFPSRIYTEVHGDGSTFSGNSFNLQGTPSLPAGSNVWLGNVWAPNGAISITNPFPSNPSTTPDIIGALWSGKSVTLNNNIRLVYVAPANVPSYIDPYYPPPVGGKVNTANNIIGAELFSLSQSTNTNIITSITQNEIFVLDNAGKVMIEVVSKTPNNTILRQQLINLGMTGLIDNGPHIYTITGFFPINNLQQLNTLNTLTNDLIQYVRPLYPPISNAGQVTTQGDTTMRSHNVKTRFGLDGTGVKIGVLSDSYNSLGAAQNDVAQGDLPGGASNPINTEPVQVLADTKGNDEGRAMLQIVHDVAPKSKLAFRTGFLSAGDFAKGILELASPTLPGGRCDVIVDDITYITEPFLRDGIVANIVDEVAAQGVTYFSSAGNFGNKSYENDFVGVTNTSVIPTGQIHRFGSNPADIYQTLNLKPGSYTIVLQWSDDFRSLGTTGVQTDMDLYLVGNTGFTLFGFNRSNLFGDPFEVCPFTVKEETNAKLMVVRAGGTGNVRFKYIILRGEGTIVDFPAGGSSIVGHPNADGAIAVGAMLYANFPQFTPVWPGVASFSSRGGTSTLKNNSFVTRNKPELVGPNGTNTTVNLGGAVFNDGDPYPNFFGTSAAAPHVAAVGALLIQGRKKFNLQTTVTPGEIRAHLQSSAGKFLNQVDHSFEGGYGYVQADNAVLQIANARPIVDELIAVVPFSQNGTQPFQVKIKGKYLTNSTQIYVSGSPVTTTVSSDKTEATATVPAITNGQNPPFQLFNAAKSTSGLDGGLSEELFFFGSRVAVTIKAVNKSRKYGQNNPSFTIEILYNGVPMNHPDTLAKLKLDGNNLTFTTIATPASNAGLYGIFPSRTTPLAVSDPLLTQYGFTFVSGTLSVGKMPLKITPQNKQIKYGEYPGDIVYNYDLLTESQSPANSSTILEDIKALHKKYLADNALVVINGFNNQNPGMTTADLTNMSTMASFQSVRNARKFIVENGRLQPLVNNINPSQIGDQRFIVDVSAQSLANYKTNPSNTALVQSLPGSNARGLLNLKALTNGTARASLSESQPIPMVNGQLLAMVNGQLQAMVNGQLQALVNSVTVPVQDLVFQNGQLVALVNGVWVATTNGQLQALVNGQQVTVNLSIVNGQLQAIVNGQLMALVNGQLQAIVNGQTLSIVNGQLQALVNGQLMPLVNGQLQAMVNGQLQAMVNGQLVALVNGQLMALVNNKLEIVQELTLVNGQLQALVNGQLQALVNGQLQAMVNGVVTNIPNANITLVNGQLQAMVNGQLQALVNGQLQALVNGQLQPLVNGAAVAVQSVRQLANGQLQALVNGTYIPIANGQLQALVNGQLLAMVNGQLMALVNGELTFAVFVNSQLQALVNGQLQALVNGQLQAMVNGQLQALVNSVTPVDNSYSIVNGQLQALVNGQTWAYANGQLLALVNGQLQALVNNFDVSGTNNNAKTLVLVDQDDITKQSGDVGGMFAMNMITGLNAGMQTLIPGGFVNENFEVTYGLGNVTILPAPLIAKANDATRVYGDPNPDFTVSYAGFAYGENNITPPVASTTATVNSNVGPYPITLSGGSSTNYSIIYQPGTLTIGKAPLSITADNQSRLYGGANPNLTATLIGLKNNDSQNSLGIVLTTTAIPSSPVGVYPIVVPATSLSNYNVIASTNGILTITGAAPSISCPSNITANNTAGQCGANVSFTATENIGNPASTITYSHAPGSFFPIGTTTVTATATNAIGNSVCRFTITVVDNQAPIITCAPIVTINNTPGQCTGTTTLIPPTVTDNCGGSGAELVLNGSFSNGPANWSHCSNLVEAQNFEATYGGISAINNVAEIDHEPVSLCQNINGFIIGKAYTLKLKASRRIAEGPTALTVAANVTISSGVLNSFVSRSNTVFNFTEESFTFIATQTTHQLTITPNFDYSGHDATYGLIVDDISIKGSEVVVSNNAPTNYPIGNTIVTWTATDNAGNFSTCNQTVTVVDNQAPVLTGVPANITVQCNGAIPQATNITVTDNCSNNLMPVYNQSIEIYEQGWENGTSGWSASNGYSFDLVDDPSSPFSPKVHKITQAGAAGNYFSPFIDVQAGRTYIVSGWIKWESGNTPFIGIDRYNSASGYIGENWLIGGQNYVDNFGGAVTNTSSIATGWKFYSKIFTAPVGTSKVKIKTELFSGQTKGGLPIGYFDNISIGEVITNLPTTTGNKIIKRVWTATDAAGNFTTGTQTVSVVDNQAPQITCPSQINNALTFSVFNQRVVVPHTETLDPKTALTLEAWVNPANTSGVKYIISKGDNDQAPGHYGLLLIDNKVQFMVEFSAGLNSNGVIAANTWTHVAATWDGSSMKLYINGVLDATRAFTGTNNGLKPANTSPLLIGSVTITGVMYQMVGQIDEVRIWNTAKTQSELQAGRNKEISGRSQGLVGYYRLNEGTGTTVADASVYGHNGNLGGTTLPVWATSTSPIVETGVILAYADAGNCSSNVTIPLPQTTDNCGSVNYSNNFNSTANASGVYPVGLTPVIWTATDAAGNATTCSITVKVVDDQAPTISCPANVSVALNSAGSQVNISASIINNRVVISSSAIAQTAQSGFLSPQNEQFKTLSGSCNCPPGHGVVGYTGRVGDIVDQFRLICAPMNSDGSPGTPVVTTTCYNGGQSGGQVGPFMAPQGSWMTGFRIGDVNYYGRSGTLTSIEGYSQTYTDVINGSANRFLIQKMAGVNPPQLTTDQYAPSGAVLTGMNYYNVWEYSNTVQFRYQPLVSVQELASFAVTDNCTGNLNVNLVGNTTYTSANVGSNPLTIQVTDAAGNSSTCTSVVTVVNNIGQLTNNSGTPSNPNSLFVNEPVTDKDSKPFEDKLYPNPANSIVRLQLKDDVQSGSDIRMYDGVGKLNVRSSRRINTGLYEINVSGLSAGIYIIQAKTAAGLKTFKFIKL